VLDKPPQRRVIGRPLGAGAVVVQPDTGFLALTGELVTGDGLAAGEADAAPGQVAHFARFRRAVDGVDRAAKIQQQIWVAADFRHNRWVFDTKRDFLKTYWLAA